MKWPEYDQSIPPAQRFPHLNASSTPPHWWQADFDDRATSPIGDYPRHVPLQWAQLKDRKEGEEMDGWIVIVIFLNPFITLNSFCLLGSTRSKGIR